LKRLRPFLAALLACAAFALCTGTALAADSGSTALPKLDKIGIIDLLQAEALSDPTDYYDEEPSVTAPHAAGVVRQEILDAGLNRVNVTRRLAGLPAVSTNDTFNDYAQKASVVMAANAALSHYPARPEGMDSSFYQTGYYGAGHSNIYSWMTTAANRFLEDPITASIDSYMGDSNAYNVDRLGHRRWLLNPTLGDIGLGVAHNFDGGYSQIYSATFVQGPETGYVPYDFISWPASGLFPNTYFIINENPRYYWDARSDAWSVALNPQRYWAPDPDAVEVTLTETATGRSWVFNNDQEYALADTGLYFNVDTGGYGEGWAIIFRPTDIQQYEGEFTVSITGIQTRAGADTTLEYTVEFFTPTCLRGHSYVSQTLEPTCTQPGQRFQTCTVCGKMTDAVELDPLGHDYARAVVEVTCDAPGTVTDTCSRCGDIVPVEETPALGHDWTAAPVCVDEAYHAVLCLRENCGAEKDSADHAMTFVVEDHLPYRVCTGCELRLSALTVTEEADAVTVTLDHVPQPLWVMAARYDGSHRLVSLRMEQFTQAGAHEFLLPAGEETRVFFLTERYVPFYLVK